MSRLSDEDLKNLIDTSYRTLVKIYDPTAPSQQGYVLMSIAQSNLAIVELLQRLLDEQKTGFNK